MKIFLLRLIFKSAIWKTKLNPNKYNFINYNSNIYILENTMYNEVENSKLYKIKLKL
jgi:hypothetical protein